MNILVLNYEFPPLGGGAAPVSYEISTGYVRLGHAVDVVTMGYKNLPRFESSKGLRIFRVKCLRRRLEICQPLEQLTYLISARPFCHRLMRSTRYDIIHCHFLIPTGWLARSLHKDSGIPYIITSHGSDVPHFNQDRFTLLHRFTPPFLRMIIRDAALITTPSKYLKYLIETQLISRTSDHIVIQPNGTRSLKQQNVPKENIIVSVGRLLPRKGFHLLISAFLAINPSDWKLVIIGEGPDRHRLESLAGNDKRIVFTGWLDNANTELAHWLNKAKIFSLLSTSESQGIVYLEAMSAGCAILALDTTACRETVTSDVGYLIPTSNLSSIQNRLKQMMENPGIISQMSQNSETRYRTYYTWDTIVKSYERMLYDCISKPT